MIPFFCDAETYSSVPLLEEGLDRYLTAVEPLIWTYCDEQGAVGCWDVTGGGLMPSEFEDNVQDERVTLVAHNAQFDRKLFKRFDEFIPVDATGFQLNGTINLEQIYGVVLDFIENEFPGGDGMVQQMNGVMAAFGFTPKRASQ